MDIVVLILLILVMLAQGFLLALRFTDAESFKKHDQKNEKLHEEGYDTVADLLELLRKEIKENTNTAKVMNENSSLLRENVILKEKQKEYRQFFATVLDVLQNDTHFLRSDLFRRFGAVPEFQDLNTQIQSFENKIEATKEALREYRMIEIYDE